jgi:hypothetical protein
MVAVIYAFYLSSISQEVFLYFENSVVLMISNHYQHLFVVATVIHKQQDFYLCFGSFPPLW